MNTMKSNYLNVDLPLQMYEGENERKEKILVINHNSLENLLYNELPKIMATKNMKFRYRIEKLYISDTIASFSCQIEDSYGRSVYNTGETNKAFIPQDDVIGQKNYIRIAKNRAIDAALIQYLALPTVEGRVGKIYSNAEDLRGMSYQRTPIQTQPPVAAPTSASQTQNRMQMQPMQSMQQPSNNYMQPITNTPTDWSQYMIEFGAWKGHSIEEIYTHGNDGIKWLFERVQDAESGRLYSKEGMTQYPMIREFLHQRGVL